MDKKNPSTRKIKQDTPLSRDNLLLLNNVISQKKPPEELNSLVSTNSITIHNGTRQTKPEIALQKIASAKDRSSWRLNINHDFIWGLPGKTTGRHSPGKIMKDKSERSTLETHRPDWTDLIYHPKLSGERISRPLRRINGNRIKPFYVFGNEDRQPFYPQGYPWQCIGKLLVWSDPSTRYPQWTGSGALIGRNVVLTAGHMAPWGANPWMAQFIPAYYDGASTLGASVFSYVESYYGYNAGDRVAWDMLVMKLYDPLGDSLGYFGSKSYDDSWEDGPYWTLVGYPDSIANAERPSYQSGFSFHDDDEDGSATELETDNGDASEGDSGGPLFGWWNDGPYVIGVLSGGEEEYKFPFSTEDNNVGAGGDALNDLIRWARNNW